MQRVLDGVALAEELGVPRDLDVGAGGGDLADEAASRAAVPTGTVDLPTTSARRVMWLASSRNAPST